MKLELKNEKYDLKIGDVIIEDGVFMIVECGKENDEYGLINLKDGYLLSATFKSIQGLLDEYINESRMRILKSKNILLKEV